MESELGASNEKCPELYRQNTHRTSVEVALSKTNSSSIDLVVIDSGAEEIFSTLKLG